MINVQKFYRTLTISELLMRVTHVFQKRLDLEIKLITLRFSSAKF